MRFVEIQTNAAPGRYDEVELRYYTWVNADLITFIGKAQHDDMTEIYFVGGEMLWSYETPEQVIERLKPRVRIRELLREPD